MPVRRKIVKRRIAKRPIALSSGVGPIIDRPQLRGINVGGCEVTASTMAEAGRLKADKTWQKKVRTGLRCTDTGVYPDSVDGTKNRALLGVCLYCGQEVWLVRTFQNPSLYAAFCGNVGSWLWAGVRERMVRKSATGAGYGGGV